MQPSGSALPSGVRVREVDAEVIPGTMAMTKELINRSQALTLEDSLRLEQHAQAMALGTPQTLAAMEAFLSKSRT